MESHATFANRQPSNQVTSFGWVPQATQDITFLCAFACGTVLTSQ